MKTKLMADGAGLIVPINVEAMCVDKDSIETFKPAPYNFAELPNASKEGTPYLSEKIMTGSGSVAMGTGVHLHWALPDGLTRGTSPQDGTGKVQFPDTPDRWMITRTFCDMANPDKPVNKVKSWVIESNYVSDKQPDGNRPSISVPFKNEDPFGQQYRYLGRVQEYETWRTQHLHKLNNPTENHPDRYVEGLSAIGYGTPQFSASYQTCKSIFGFHDTEQDLDKLGDNILLSYHIVGWYHDIAKDPISQLPLQLNPSVFDDLVLHTEAAADKDQLRQAYTIRQQDAPYVLIDDIKPELQLKLINILIAAGFDFLQNLLNQCKWSLPLGTGSAPVTHTLLTGVISDVKFNKLVSSFSKVSSQVNVAIGNTSSQALAALIASVSGSSDKDSVELLLDALQLGKLRGVTKLAELNRLEDLAIALHTSGYNSTTGGGFWEVTKIGDEEQTHNLKSLAQTMGDDLNKLNKLQLDHDNGVCEIESMRAQIFMDWYRFMLVLHPGKDKHNIDVNNLVDLIGYEIDKLDDKIAATNTTEIKKLAAALSAKLPEGYKLANSGAARYWQPTEPVVLFQGKDITPPQRYGGDGRFMPDNTLACRLSSQLIERLTLPANLVGNASAMAFDAGNMPHLSNLIPLDYGAQIHALFTESSLLNPAVMAVQCIAAGATAGYKSIAAIIKTNRDNYVTPPLLQPIPVAAMEGLKAKISEADFTFLMTMYEVKGDVYQLRKPEDELKVKDLKRIHYIFVSAAAAWASAITFEGPAPSEVYFVTWNGNPWLPFSFSWEVVYHPFEDIAADKNAGKQYDPEFISKRFTLGDVNYEHKGPIPAIKAFNPYRNSIFMSPHAEENFQVQIQKYIDGQPGADFDITLKELAKKLKDFPPILSQSLNGLNDAMIMRNQVMQLQVKDPTKSKSFRDFTDLSVRPAVAGMNTAAPSPGNFYNPIRAGVMKIQSLTIVDVFGRNIVIDPSEKLIVAKTLTAPGLAANAVYLPPRIVQPSRLMFRWLAASNRAMEMNSHPATTAICGWVLANHLDNSLWFYEAEGAPIGSLILTEDHLAVRWQGVPGGKGFNQDIIEFFGGEGKDINDEIKKLALALYNGGNGSYLHAFMKANDKTFSLIQPQNYKQMGSNAVLMGSPIAVAQASLSLEIKGLPAYSNGWADLKEEADSFAEDPETKKPKNDNGFTKVKFPVRLGNMKQTEDGLLGYFKSGNYGHYYVTHTKTPTDKVSQPDETNITLALEESAHEAIVTLLLDPRGSVHATTGVLPVKKIDLPPAQFADALENLEIAFLTSPVLYNDNQPALPVPAQGGTEWHWLQSELSKWAASQNIQPVDDRANLTDPPQEIREGWLLLTNFNK